MASQTFNPIINRPTPWWASSANRTKLITLATEHFAACEETNPGSVGLYVHSKQVLQARLASLQCLQSIDKVFFATKANNSPDIISLFLQQGAGIECVSLNEMKLVLSIEPLIDANRMLFTPNFASKAEIKAINAVFSTPERQAAQAEGIITQLFPFVTIDNLWVLENWSFDDVFAGFPLFLRVDPGQDGYGHHSHVSTGSSSKFGMIQDDLRAFFSTNPMIAAQVIGLHMHKGSGVNTSEEWSKTAGILTQYLDLFPNITHLDLGGGLGIPYKPTDKKFDLSSLDETLLPVRQQFPNLTFCVEPGRFLVAESGVLLCKVNQLKKKNAYHFVGLSAGMNTLMRPALYDAYHHIVNLSKYHETYLQQAADDVDPNTNSSLGLHFSSKLTEDNTLPVVVNVVGPICETGDFLGKNRVFPANTTENDIVLIDATGAYGKSMANNYNLRTAEAHDIVTDFE